MKVATRVVKPVGLLSHLDRLGGVSNGSLPKTNQETNQDPANSKVPTLIAADYDIGGELTG